MTGLGIEGKAKDEVESIYSLHKMPDSWGSPWQRCDRVLAFIVSVFAATALPVEFIFRKLGQFDHSTGLREQLQRLDSPLAPLEKQMNGFLEMVVKGWTY
jgi:hypothetical protein